MLMGPEFSFKKFEMLPKKMHIFWPFGQKLLSWQTSTLKVTVVVGRGDLGAYPPWPQIHKLRFFIRWSDSEPVPIALHVQSRSRMRLFSVDDGGQHSTGVSAGRRDSTFLLYRFEGRGVPHPPRRAPQGGAGDPLLGFKKKQRRFAPKQR